MRHKEDKQNTNNLEFKEEHRSFLCRNKNSVRCSSLDVEQETNTINSLLIHLADILVAIYLANKNHDQ